MALAPAQGILIAHLSVRCWLLPSPSLGPLQPPAHRYSFLHSTSQIGPLASGRQLTSGVTLQGVLSHCDRADHRECWPSSLFHRKRTRGPDCSDRVPCRDRRASSTRGIRDLGGPGSITNGLRAEPDCSLLPAKGAVCHPTPATNSCPLPSQSASVSLSSPGFNTAISPASD